MAESFSTGKVRHGSGDMTREQDASLAVREAGGGVALPECICAVHDSGWQAQSA